MNISPFPEGTEITDFEFLLRTRLSNPTVMWPDQATSLLGYMFYPNDNAKWQTVVRLLSSWADHKSPEPVALPDNLKRTQANWLKVAAIFQNYCDLIEGHHQERRGGASIGKAITLASANFKRRGTKNSNLWKVWGDYKDVAHVITPVLAICAEVNRRFRHIAPIPTGLNPTQFGPFQLAMLMPDLVLAVAKSFEAIGLTLVNDSRHEPALDPDTLWRIPENINVAPVPQPIQKLTPSDIAVLNERRAGKRGKADKTTPVSE